MKHRLFYWMSLIIWLLSACRSHPSPCTEHKDASRYLDLAQLMATTPTPSSAMTAVEIGGKRVWVDKVVSGPLCNDTWRGTVYVTCDVQVAPWQEQPTFLKGCDLKIEPGTVVYVAAHNDAAYYQGCACHTAELNTP